MSLIGVDIASGSDAAVGTIAAPFLTIDHALSVANPFDIIYVKGTSATAVAPAASEAIDNITITQWPDAAQATWYGFTSVATWTDIGGGVYTKAIPAGLGADGIAVLFNYVGSVTARGSKFGTLKRLASAAAVVTAAGLAGTEGDFFYQTTATGLITAYFGGDNPNLGVTHYVSRKGQIAIELTGTGNVVNGLWFLAWHNNTQGACVWIKDGTASSQIVGCRSWDCDPHAFIISGQAALMSNAVISGCTSDGAGPAGSHMTFFQTNGFGNASGTFLSCHVERHTHYNIDESETAACTQTGYYNHSDAGTPFASILCDGCTSYDQTMVNAAVASADSITAPSNAADFNTYIGRADRCNFQNQARSQFTNSYAFRRSVLEYGQQGTSGLCLYGGNGCICAPVAGSRLLFESTAIILNGTGGAADASCIGIHMAAAADIDYRFVNCSIMDIGSVSALQASTLFTYQAGTDNTVFMRLTGCIFTFRVDAAGQQSLVYSEGSDGNQFITSDNVWGLLPVITVAGSISIASPGAHDANAIDLDANPFVSSTDLRISPASSIYTRKRATSAVVPSGPYLINGPYDRSFGAYSGAGGSDNASVRASRGGRTGRVARV